MNASHPPDPASQAACLVLVAILTEQGQSQKADQTALSLVVSLHTSPHVSLALFCSCLHMIGPSSRSLLSSPAYLLGLSNPSTLKHYVPGARCSALESLLDCPDDDFTRSVWTALPFKPSPGLLASTLRRSEDFSQASIRLGRAESRGWIEGRTLRLLSSHSSWCDNGIVALAQSMIDQRALSRSLGPKPLSPRPGVRI